MLKKRSKAISMLICLAFLFTMIMPATVFASSYVDFSSSAATVSDSDDPQNLGFVKLEDFDDVAAIYIEITLPSDVDWDTGASIDKAGTLAYDSNGDGTKDTQFEISDFITTNDTTNIPEATFVSGDGDEYVVWFDTTDGAIDWDSLYIKAKFQYIIVDDDADDDIYASVVVRGIDDDEFTWRASEDCLIGEKAESEITVTAKAAKSIEVGDDQKLAKVTFTENIDGAFEVGDTIVMTLPDDVEWDLANIVAHNGSAVVSGNYGLAATITQTDDDELTLTITGSSEGAFEDKFSLTGYVTVFPGTDDGDVEVSVESDLGDADFDDVDVVLAVIGESDLTIDVDDDSDDDIYIADYNKELDTFTFEANADFAAEDSITLTLSDGVKWYMTEAQFEAAVDDVEVLGFYDDNESVWLEVTGTPGDELEFANLKVATTPDAPAGDITVTIGEDYFGDFVIGTVVDQAEVSADSVVVSSGDVSAAAGDITLTETAKDVFTAGDFDNYFLSLSLPSGVAFADKPTVSINDDEVDVNFYSEWEFDINTADDKHGDKFSDGDSDLYIVFDEDDFSSSKVDTITISDILYTLDSRLNNSEVEVAIGGTVVNYLAEAEDTVVIEDLEKDYEDGEVYAVVNATTEAEGNADSVYTIGSTTYTINGIEYTMDVAPYISGDRTFMPIRYVAYALGINDANILWDGAAQTVTLMKGDKVVQLQVGSTTLLINGATVTMDVAPVNVNGRVCLPIRFVAQAFGAVVGWDAATQQVTIEM